MYIVAYAEEAIDFVLDWSLSLHGVWDHVQISTNGIMGGIPFKSTGCNTCRRRKVKVSPAISYGAFGK